MLKFTQKELALVPCSECGRTGSDCHDGGDSELLQKCHTKAGLKVRYTEKEGAVKLYCNECNKFVLAIAVKKGSK